MATRWNRHACDGEVGDSRALDGQVKHKIIFVDSDLSEVSTKSRSMIWVQKTVSRKDNTCSHP